MSFDYVRAGKYFLLADFFIGMKLGLKYFCHFHLFGSLSWHFLLNTELLVALMQDGQLVVNAELN